MRRTLKFVSIIMIVVMLTGCSKGVLSGLKEHDKNYFVNGDKKYEDLVKVVEKSNFKGSVIIATDDEVILFGGPFVKDTNGDPVTPDTTYEIGSITKTFTAIEIFKLIEKDKLSLDDTLSKFFPDYEKGKDITIYQLLHMQSGIVDYVNAYDQFFGISEKEFMELNKSDKLTDEEFLKYLYEADLVFEPGEETDYSNTNYHLLALIIEQIEGVSYKEVIKRDIFDPCGMKNSSSMTMGDVTSVPIEDLGYMMFQNNARGAGDIHSTATDMLAFDRAFNGGKLLNEESMALMKEWVRDYGCGLMPYTANAYGHSGSTDSYVSNNVIIDSKEFGDVYVISFCSSPYDGATMMGMVNDVLRELE